MKYAKEMPEVNSLIYSVLTLKWLFIIEQFNPIYGQVP